MDSTRAVVTRGLSIRWVEVPAERGRTRLEMRWGPDAPEVPAASGASAMAGPPVGTPPPHAA